MHLVAASQKVSDQSVSDFVLLSK